MVVANMFCALTHKAFKVCVCITVGSHTVVGATPTVGNKDTVSW